MSKGTMRTLGSACSYENQDLKKRGSVNTKRQHNDTPPALIEWSNYSNVAVVSYVIPVNGTTRPARSQIVTARSPFTRGKKPELEQCRTSLIHGVDYTFFG